MPRMPKGRLAGGEGQNDAVAITEGRRRLEDGGISEVEDSKSLYPQVSSRQGASVAKPAAIGSLVTVEHVTEAMRRILIRGLMKKDIRASFDDKMLKTRTINELAIDNFLEKCAIGAWLNENVDQAARKIYRPGISSPLPGWMSPKQSSWWQRFFRMTNNQRQLLIEQWDGREDDEFTDRHAFAYWLECKRSDQRTDTPILPDDVFSTVVVDPPWPMPKIEREERPNQDELDYAPMTLDEIAMLKFPKIAEDAHLYLWTTHKLLPHALEMVDVWGFKYQCLMTWVKNVGITPFSWMYSTEHVLFCRRGNLDLLANGLRLDFSAPVTKHSEKPEVFYERVRHASPALRIDMFARTEHEGFTAWGNEAPLALEG